MATLTRPSRTAAYRPDSPLRLHSAEPILAATGSRALLVQLARPAIADSAAADAAELGHLRATTNAVLSVVWGDDAGADRAWRSLATDVGDATPLATQPDDARQWVWASLVDSTTLMLQRYVRPLTEARADTLYADWRRVGAWLGIPDTMLPPDRESFATFCAASLADGSVVPGDAARRVGVAAVTPNAGGAGATMPSDLAFGLLPTAMREAYGIVWTQGRQAAFARADLLLRTSYRRLPAPMRQTLPANWIAARRMVHRLTRDRPVIRWPLGE